MILLLFMFIISVFINVVIILVKRVLSTFLLLIKSVIIKKTLLGFQWAALAQATCWSNGPSNRAQMKPNLIKSSFLSIWVGIENLMFHFIGWAGSNNSNMLLGIYAVIILLRQLATTPLFSFFF